MKLMAIFLLIATYGCSSSPTKYEEASNGEDKGYSEKDIDSKLKLATFRGNSATKKEDAELYAKFRAIEICSEQNTNTHILIVKDKTYEKQVSQTTTNYPAYGFYGASPYYGGYSSAVTTNTWNESYTYPVFEVYFECVDRPVDARVSFKMLSQSDMKKLVNDLKGAVQIEAILPDSPNKNQFKVADIIIKANGNRVENIFELFQASRNVIGKKFNVEFFRDGVKMNADVKFLDVTDLVVHAQNVIIKEGCKLDELKSRPICK